MAQHALIEIERPVALKQFKLPEGVNDRLQELLTKQDQSGALTVGERKEAEGLIEFAEMLSLLRLRTEAVG